MWSQQTYLTVSASDFKKNSGQVQIVMWLKAALNLISLSLRLHKNVVLPWREIPLAIFTCHRYMSWDSNIPSCIQSYYSSSTASPATCQIHHEDFVMRQKNIWQAIERQHAYITRLWHSRKYWVSARLGKATQWIKMVP